MSLDINLVVIGLGGTGSFLVDPLLRLLCFSPNSNSLKVTFVDADSYESKNSERQLFVEAALGVNKAKYHAERLSFLVPIAYVEKYVDTKGLAALLDPDRLNIIVSCVDNDASRKAHLDATDNIENFIFVTPGNEDEYGQCQAYGILDGEYKLGIDPRTYNPGITEPKDEIPSEHDDCMTRSITSTQLIGANFMAAASAFLIIENWLAEKGFAYQVTFDIRQFKMKLG